MAATEDLPRRLAALNANLQAAAGQRPGCSARECIYRSGALRLFHYLPLVAAQGGVTAAPLLIVYALVNRPEMLDLQPDRSLVRRLLERGHDLYLIDWGDVTPADRCRDLDDYIAGDLHRCVQQVLRQRQCVQLDLLGVCQGGTFSLCYTALHPELIHHLVLMVTPVDFHTPGNLLSQWAQQVDVDALVAAHGVVPGALLNAAYLLLKPFQLMQQKYVHLLDVADDPAQVSNFMRMEHWIFDSPDQAGAAFRQFVQWFYKENRLMSGPLRIGGRDVDLGRIDRPLLNVYGLQDHLVPPAASKALRERVPHAAYQELALDAGHIGMYVSSRVQRELPEAVSRWLCDSSLPRHSRT